MRHRIDWRHVARRAIQGGNILRHNLVANSLVSLNISNYVFGLVNVYLKKIVLCLIIK